MLLFELYKVLYDNTSVLIYDHTDSIIYYGFLDKLDVDILQSRVKFLRPISVHEILIKIEV